MTAMKKKNGKFVYKNKNSMEGMHRFYDRAMESLGISYREEYIETSYGTTHIIFAGDESKPPVFTLHGGNGITPINLKLFKPLLKDYRIIAPDVIGMPGKSEPNRNLNTYREDFGHWEREILDILGIDRINFVVSSYSAAMLLSLAKVAPGRIDKAALLVPSGITHGPLLPIMTGMSIPFIKYYYSPSQNSLSSIMEIMSSRDDEICLEFFDIMMSTYKMEMRPPKEYNKNELAGFHSPVIVFASDEDIFFPANRVFPKAMKLFCNTPMLCRIGGKHMPSDATMRAVCRKITEFFG